MAVDWLNVPWELALIVVPLAAALLAFAWPRAAQAVAVICALLVCIAVAGLGARLLEYGTLRHAIGGWGAPLGIELHADGLSWVLLAATALVGLGISVYATAYFRREDAQWFWPLWLFLLAALNALFQSADVFNLYVTLELVGLAAVALTALQGARAALGGAMRYLLATLSGSLAYLLGVALLYHAYGGVDIAFLAEQATATPATWAALVLMSTGLLLKTALFPLHFWLPAAHASAPAPVSALLSALVVKASFYILLRLWIEVYAPATGIAAGELLGALGAAAVLWGSVQALRQTRLKLLVAYSTVAQIGYLFLAFPLAAHTAVTAWNAAAYLLLSHALAKAAMFLAAGNVMQFGGHDHIERLDRVVQRLPLTAFAFALAGVSIMGLPPSGGFIGKWLLLQSALAAGRWDLLAVMLLGGLLAAAYVLKVLGHAFTQAPETHEPRPVPRRMEWPALLLAGGAILLGFLAQPLLTLQGTGAPFGSEGIGP